MILLTSSAMDGLQKYTTSVWIVPLLSTFNIYAGLW